MARGDPANTLRALQRRRDVVSTGLTAAFALCALATHPPVAPLAAVLLARGVARDWLSLGRCRYLRAGLPPFLQGILTLVASLAARTIAEASFLIALGYAIALLLSIRLNQLPPATPGWRRSKTDPWLLLATLADQIVASGDIFLVGAFLSATEAGIYAAVYRLPNALQTVAGLVAITGIPVSTQIASRGSTVFHSERRRLLNRALWPAALVGLSAPLVGALIVPIFGSDYSPGRLPAMLLVVAAGVNLAATPLHPLYLALGNDRSQARLVGAAALLGIAADVLILSLGYGLAAVAAVAFVVQIGMFYGFLHGTSRNRYLSARELRDP